MAISWGLLGPENLGSERRTRTLDIGSALRLFNDLAVPGLGGVWYAKQLFLPALGIHLAGKQNSGSPASNIVVANAVEAIACWAGLFRQKGDSPLQGAQRSDPRLRGSQKLDSRLRPTFPKARKPGFYVSQPMRMAAVQALPALGLVEAGASRFNDFHVTALADNLIAAQCEPYEPCHYRQDVVTYLGHWIANDFPLTQDDRLADALSPTVPMSPQAIQLVRQLLCIDSGVDSDGQSRRVDALSWVESLRLMGGQVISWDQRPAQITSEAHWRDLRAGARFFLARDAALAALNAAEGAMRVSQGGTRLRLADPLPLRVEDALETLRLAALVFLDEGHPDQIATQFCQECTQSDPVRRLASVVERDGRVLVLRNEEIVPGMAFQHGEGTTSTADEDPSVTPAVIGRGPAWPAGISYRVRNLFMLNLDLNGTLGDWLSAQATEANANG